MTKSTVIQNFMQNPNFFIPECCTGAILVEVVYGLASRNCKGMGICKINPIVQFEHYGQNNLCSSSLAFLQILGNSTLRIDFLKESISPEQFDRRFSGRHFILDEPFYFPESLLKVLNTAIESLPSGVYPIQELDDRIRVDFLPG